MTEVETRRPVTPRNERIIFALRQAALLAVALLVAGFVTERLRPDDVLDRSITSTQFLWAIVVWSAVLLLNAVCYERSQMGALEQQPLYAATAMGVMVFVAGFFTLDTDSAGRGLIYLAANSLGVVMFWWAVISLGYLTISLLRQ